MDHPDGRGKRLPHRPGRRPVLARVRLTLSYAGFLVVAGAGLLALVFYLLRFIPDVGGPGDYFGPSRTDLLDAFWPRLWQVALVLLAVGLVGGWLLSTWMLRPLDRIAAVARRVESGSLHERVRLGGPRDEFRDVADALDAMLDRLEASIEEERRFAANASHELRTPFAITRSLLDVAAVDPSGGDVAELVTRLDLTNRRGIEIVEALLSLSALERGAELQRQPVDVAELVAAALDDVRPEAERTGIRIATRLGEGDVDADPVLLRQLVTNLLLNGIRHNIGSGGELRVGTATAGDAVEISVSNTGPVLDPATVGTLTEPFVRGAGRVAGTDAAVRGSGLGLAIVARIADAHGAQLTLRAWDTGGLDVSVRFSAPG